jgi:hypothetical protein
VARLIGCLSLSYAVVVVYGGGGGGGGGGGSFWEILCSIFHNTRKPDERNFQMRTLYLNYYGTSDLAQAGRQHVGKYTNALGTKKMQHVHTKHNSSKSG